MLIDVHAHLDELKASDIPKAVIIISNGTNPEANRKAIGISKSFSNVRYALGIYPSFAIKMNKAEVNKEIEFIRKQKPIAIGEIGLDFTYPEKEKQVAVFKKFIALAKRLNCPLIVHSRKAERQVVEILRSEDAKKAVLHCFSGSLNLAKEAEKLGFYFSIPAIILYSTHFQALARQTSLSRLLTETDSPYLSPIKGQIKGKANNPRNVAVAVKKIAEIKGITEEECENIIFGNFQGLFGS